MIHFLYPAIRFTPGIYLGKDQESGEAVFIKEFLLSLFYLINGFEKQPGIIKCRFSFGQIIKRGRLFAMRTSSFFMAYLPMAASTSSTALTLCGVLKIPASA